MGEEGVMGREVEGDCGVVVVVLEFGEMLPGAFYRSRLFWLGVPGLVFLLWVWWDSGGHSSDVNWNSKPKGYIVAVAGGAATVTVTTLPAPAMKSPLRVERRKISGSHGIGKRGFDFRPAFQPASMEDGNGFGMKYEWVMVGLWVVVLVYGVMWLGAVWWWQRRKVRVMRVAGASEVGG